MRYGGICIGGCNAGKTLSRDTNYWRVAGYSDIDTMTPTHFASILPEYVKQKITTYEHFELIVNKNRLGFWRDIDITADDAIRELSRSYGKFFLLKRDARFGPIIKSICSEQETFTPSVSSSNSPKRQAVEDLEREVEHLIEVRHSRNVFKSELEDILVKIKKLKT